MGFSKKNLRDVEDMAIKHGFSTTQEARFPGADLGAEKTGIAYLVIKSDQREAFAHRHGEAEEVYVVLAGSGRVKLDDELVDLAPFDAVRVSPGRDARVRGRPRGPRGPRVRTARRGGRRNGPRLLG